MPRLCHVVLLALVLCPAEAFSVAGLPDEIDKTSGRISFGIPFAEELRAGCPMVLKFQSGPWSPETPFGGFWTLDIVDSTAFPGDSGKTAFTHRGSGPIALRKSQKSDNAFYNGGWTAEASGRGRIVVSKKGVKDFFLVYMNGRLVREATPFYEINIDYDGKSCLPRRIRSSGGAEVAAFNCDTFGLRPLLVAVRGAGIVSFKYGEFEFFTGPEKTERNFLLKEAVFGDRLRMKIEYYAEKMEDVAVNGTIVTYSTSVCEFSNTYEWDASTGEVKKIGADLFDVKKEFFSGENPKLRSISIDKRSEAPSNPACAWAYDYENHIETLAVPSKGHEKKIHYRVSSGFSPKLIRRVEETVNGKKTVCA